MADVSTLLATQNSDNVDIRGGTISGITWTNSVISSGATINGATIGGVTPGAGTFTTLIGTTIDGVIGSVTPAAGIFTTLASSGLSKRSVSNALTAVGTNRGTSLALTSDINNVTSAASSTGVTLPASAVGQVVTLFNAGANPIQVYGAGSDTIDGVAAATGVPLANAKRANFFCVAAATYVSAQLGVVSA